MSYISPNTIVFLLKGVPLDPEYHNTTRYQTALAQQNDFLYNNPSYVKYILQENSYQRAGLGVIRVNRGYDDIVDCNYMVFQNTSYSRKYFYAFITSVEYVNNSVSLVRYEIDVIQTWMFDWRLEPCLIVRQHTDTDIVGNNIEAENFDLGEYVYNSYSLISDDLSDFAYVVSVVDDDISLSTGQKYDNVFSGSILKAFNSSDGIGIKTFIDSYIQKPEAIISIYCVPISFFGGTIADGGIVPTYGQSSVIADITVGTYNTGGTGLDGYVPLNNKLYTYPYNFLSVDNTEGQSMVIRYELSNSLNAKIMVYGTIVQPVEAIAVPVGYKGAAASDPIFTESLSISDFPLCSWSMDYFQAYIAQNSIPTIIHTLGNPFIYQPAGSFMRDASIAGSAVNEMASYYKASIHADISKGEIRANANAAHHYLGFRGGRMSVTHQRAVTIDQYFELYGYAYNRVEQPHIFGRPYWKYLQTNNSAITGDMPGDDNKKISSIFDHGITFWNELNQVGLYYLDNHSGVQS